MRSKSVRLQERGLKNGRGREREGRELKRDTARVVERWNGQCGVERG